MSDILYDAKLWLEGRPRHTRTHWQDCHLAHGHTECLVRKLLEEIELLKGYRDNAESDAAIAHLLVDRYRMTDEEREAVEWFAEVRNPLDSLDGGEYVAALRALRERIGREVFDRLCAANAPKQERTADTHATPAKGSVQGQ